jgi:hypothetical protein
LPRTTMPTSALAPPPLRMLSSIRRTKCPTTPRPMSTRVSQPMNYTFYYSNRKLTIPQRRLRTKSLASAMTN